MQEEVNQKVISLSIQGVKITASVLKAALRKFLEMDNRRKQKATQVKMAEKTGRAQEKGREKARKKIEKKKPHGKQTIKQLNAQGVQLSNLKITDENIKSFLSCPFLDKSPFSLFLSCLLILKASLLKS